MTAGSPHNPSGVPGALKSTWTYGHRSPQGLEFDPRTGRLWSTEMGPRGGDEFNLLLPGRNYGWPLTSKGVDYDGTPVEYGSSSASSISPRSSRNGRPSGGREFHPLPGRRVYAGERRHRRDIRYRAPWGSGRRSSPRPCCGPRIRTWRRTDGFIYPLLDTAPVGDRAVGAEAGWHFAFRAACMRSRAIWNVGRESGISSAAARQRLRDARALGERAGASRR
jgi:hypothetical protein